MIAVNAASMEVIESRCHQDTKTTKETSCHGSPLNYIARWSSTKHKMHYFVVVVDDTRQTPYSSSTGSSDPPWEKTNTREELHGLPPTHQINSEPLSLLLDAVVDELSRTQKTPSSCQHHIPILCNKHNLSVHANKEETKTRRYATSVHPRTSIYIGGHRHHLHFPAWEVKQP